MEREMTMETGFSLQVELIRQIQSDSGQVACYAKPAAFGCMKPPSECVWRHDCFDEAEDPGGSWREVDADNSGECWFNKLD
jgi:hypothetical protein